MNKPSRRAVVRTGVWTVPVVAAAAAAPALATSPNPPVVITGLASGCKLPGNPRGKHYGIVLNVSNSSPDPQDIIITGVTSTGHPIVTECPTTFTVPAGDSTITLYISDVTTSQQKTATVTITYMSGGQTVPFSFTIDGFHPFRDEACPHQFDITKVPGC